MKKITIGIIILGLVSCVNSDLDTEDEALVNDHVPTHNNEPIHDSLFDGTNYRQIAKNELDTLKKYENEDVYELLKSIISDNQEEIIDIYISTSYYIPTKPSHDKTEYVINIGNVEFEESDFALLQKQAKSIENEKGKIWNLNKLNGFESYYKYKVNCYKDGYLNWDKFYANGYKRIVQYGLPIFNTKKDLAIIYYSSSCGSLCGSSGYSKYKLVEGKWELVIHYTLSVS
tara:strand:- start:619 stop:1308 length:690 start_codon:yes stop_codon:yes gene_type:complete